MPKKNNSLNSEQLNYMTAVLASLSSYKDYVHENDIFYQAGTFTDIEEVLGEQIKNGDNMESPEQYDEWVKKQNEINGRLNALLPDILKVTPHNRPLKDPA